MDNQSFTHYTAEQVPAKRMSANAVLQCFQSDVECEMRRILASVQSDPALEGLYGQMAYHLGWVDEQFQPARLSSGKLLRSALLLWACAATWANEAAGERCLQQALPIAAAVEFIHNFSLIHDDIEDRDELRRHRRTVWSVWGEAQGINTGDAMSFLGRLALWDVVKQGVSFDLATRLAMMLDRACLTLCEGQYLDMSFEASIKVTPDMYLDMIKRKTATLMRTATEMGARVGSPQAEATIDALASFGEDLGMAFQLRDDLQGIWSGSTQIGKAAAGDLRRKKMSLPIIHALTNVSPHVREHITTIYQQPGSATEQQIQTLLEILDATTSREWCCSIQARYCSRAYAHLMQVRNLRSSTSEEKPLLALEAILELVNTRV
jgi:geranylgeranyl diphosphate synthase, type I